jgi:hypothetical protein
MVFISGSTFRMGKIAEPSDQDTTLLGPGRPSVFLAVCAYGLLALALLPVADRPGPVMPGINALFAAIYLVTELSTSFLLLVRFRTVRTWSLLVLGCAYFYSGLMPIPHLLTFPGAVLVEGPLLVTSPQSSSWVYNLWINGFALLSLISVSLEAFSGKCRIAPQKVGHAVTLGLCLTAVAALAVVIIAFAAADRLPPVLSGPRWTGLGSVMAYIAVVLLVASIAVILLAIGEQNRLFLWLSLALAAIAFANVLSTAGGGHFTVGWTINRLSWLTSACVLFIYLMILHAREQHLWTRASDLLRAVDDEAARAWFDNAGQMRKAVDVALHRFVAHENVIRFKRMLEESHDDAMRKTLLQMLAAEENRLKDLGESRSRIAVATGVTDTGSRSC